MAPRNNHWYDINEGRKYPLDDRATAVSDAGEFLPSELVADLQLAWPAALGNLAFLSSAASTPGLVTVTLQAASGLGAESAFVPLASVSVVRSRLDVRRPYPLEPLQPGVGGWIVFGQGVLAEWHGRFSTAAQGLLTPRAARPHRGLPVTSLGKYGLDRSLTGVVRLSGDPPVEVVGGARTIDGIEYDVAVVRLREETGRLTGRTAETVLRELAGPCAGRPDSRSCGDPQPIEFVGSTGPDCDGVLEIVFRGCAVVGRNVDDCGVVLDCRFGLSDSCRPPFLPDAQGRLPSEVEPRNPVPPLEPEPEVPVESESLSASAAGALPYCESFDDGVADDFSVVEGAFGFEESDSPDEPCGDLGRFSESVSSSLSVWDGPLPRAWASTEDDSAGTRNLAVWDGFDFTVLYRRVSAGMLIRPGPSGARHVAGLVVNRRPHATLPGRWTYYTAELDWDSQAVRIRRFNGTSFATAVSVSVPGLQLSKWYRLHVDVVPGLGTGVKLTLTVEDADDDSTVVVLGPLTVSNLLPGNGRFGLVSHRTHALWSWFRVSETS